MLYLAAKAIFYHPRLVRFNTLTDSNHVAGFLTRGRNKSRPDSAGGKIIVNYLFLPRRNFIKLLDAFYAPNFNIDLIEFGT